MGMEGNSKIQITFAGNYFSEFHRIDQSPFSKPPEFIIQRIHPTTTWLPFKLTQRLVPFLSPKHSWEKRLVFRDQGTYWPRGGLKASCLFTKVGSITVAVRGWILLGVVLYVATEKAEGLPVMQMQQ